LSASSHLPSSAPEAAAGDGVPSSLDRRAEASLQAIRSRGTYRRMRVMEGALGPRVVVDGRRCCTSRAAPSGSLTTRGERARARGAGYGCASGGSRLIAGNLPIHERLEEELAELLGTEAALVFSTGYMANAGVIPALAGPGDAIVSDALNHASIIDGCRLARAETRVFPHGDLDALEATLRELAANHRRALLAVDGLYSMDGDLAPLAEMAALARRFGALLLLDDAHGTGTLGARGGGTAEHLGVNGGVDALVGTLGKALGSFGAFVAGSASLRDLLVNVARSFIFSCALAPPQVEAARAALRVVRREPWRRERLRVHGERLRRLLADRGVSTHPSTTHIIPVVLGENRRTMATCERLLERGFYAQGIRHPSVPEGSARLRLTPIATHREEEIDALADAVAAEVALSR
jgi:8-amino-7-oxononanoate synthase